MRRYKIHLAHLQKSKCDINNHLAIPFWPFHSVWKRWNSMLMTSMPLSPSAPELKFQSQCHILEVPPFYFLHNILFAFLNDTMLRCVASQPEPAHLAVKNLSLLLFLPPKWGLSPTSYFIVFCPDFTSSSAAATSSSYKILSQFACRLIKEGSSNTSEIK